MKKSRRLVSFSLCLLLALTAFFAMALPAYAGSDKICDACWTDSHALGMTLHGTVNGNGINVRYHHEATSNSDILASANKDNVDGSPDAGTVSRVYNSNHTWYYIDIIQGNAIGHNGWVRGDYIDLPEFD